jgi:hypothetical protein
MYVYIIKKGLGNVAPYAAAMILNPLPSPIWKFRLTLAMGALPPFIVLLATYGAEESDEFKNSTRKRCDGLKREMRCGLDFFMFLFLPSASK